MTAQEINELVASIGLPYAYYQFPEGTDQPAPFICFYLSGSNDFMADRKNYVKIRQLNIELYTDNKDYDTERAVEAALAEHNISYRTEESYLNSERLYMVTYMAEIILNDEV